MVYFFKKNFIKVCVDVKKMALSNFIKNKQKKNIQYILKYNK